MSLNNIYKILLFYNIIILVFSRSIDYGKSDIDDMHTSFFNTKKEKIYFLGNLIDDVTIIAFTDLDYDKYTDIISYKYFENNHTFVFYVHLYDDDIPGFKKKKILFSIGKDKDDNTFTEKTSVRNLNVGSFFDKKQYCFLVTFQKKLDEDDFTLSHYIKCRDSEGVYLNITSNILLMNKDENKQIRILFSKNDEYENNTYICTLGNDIKDGCKERNFINYMIDVNEANTQYLKYPISLLGGLAYVDLTGNCIPDIVLSHDFYNDGGSKVRTIEIYAADKINNEIKYTFKDKIELNMSKDKYGAFAITRINDKKSEDYAPMLDIIIPITNLNKIVYYKNPLKKSFKWSKKYCDKYAKDINIQKINKIFEEVGNYTLGINDPEAYVELDDSFPTIIRAGDFLDSSNPGLIVKQNIKKGDKKYSQITLYERDDGKFKYYNDFKISKINSEKYGIEGDEEFTKGLFFDIDEAGSLSMILPTNKNKNFFFYNYQKNVYFLKSKLMNDEDYYYDINLGSTFRYIVTDKDGDRHMDVSFQMAQTSDMNIPLPYSLIGLDDTNNYVENFESESGNILKGKVEFSKSSQEDYRGDTPIIPNTQMLISKYYSGRKIKWNVDLIVQPMDQIWLFFMIVVFVLLIVLSIIIYLHIKEVKEEQKETTKFKSWFA